MLEILEEHVLGAAEADAFGAHFAGLAGILGGVRIGANTAGRADLIGPLHHGVVVLGHFGRRELDLALVNRAVIAVERDPLALANDAAVGRHLLCRHSRCTSFSQPTMQHLPQPRATTAAWLVLPPVAVSIALRHGHAAHVFGAGFAADQHHLLALAGPFLGLMRREDGSADGGAGNGVDARRQILRLREIVPEHGGVDHRIKQPLDILRT